jgi:uncharacterized membrane protein YhaH (DUF805 family)
VRRKACGCVPGPQQHADTREKPLLILLVLFYLAVLVPSIAVAVRRLHDAGYSGWLVLLALIPSVGGLILLVFTLLPPSPAGGKYDPAPAYPTAPYSAGPYPPAP